jgi:hypothetical protein
MLNNFAGYYCTPAQYAENENAQRPITFLSYFALVGFIVVSVYLLKRSSRLSKRKRLALYIMIPAGGIFILIGLMALSFAVTPHFC